MTPTIVQPPTSPRAEQLGHELSEVVRDYREKHPETNDYEVRQALHTAARNTALHNERQAKVVLVALAVAGLLFVGGLTLYMTL